mmetsp:Transcript_16215/g.22855  ORF Transcript_16215/g.22855 Transcript_16215/m.22855 type:complete len:230 (-) Transcript_16215:382-1071(-)
MGRYTTVQAYADNNSNVRAISYDQATGASASSGGGGSTNESNQQSRGGLKVEKVDNPYGSTAGAGSGEFHVYRHARAREMARWKQLDEEEKERIREEEFKSKVETYKSEEDRKTEQRRKKRQRQKEAKQRKKNLKLAGVISTTETAGNGDTNDEEEFTYIPMHAQKKSEVEEDKKDNNEKESPQVPFANDGSFLEMMKKKLEEESQKGGSNDGDADTQPPSKKRAVATS